MPNIMLTKKDVKAIGELIRRDIARPLQQPSGKLRAEKGATKVTSKKAESSHPSPRKK